MPRSCIALFVIAAVFGCKSQPSTPCEAVAQRALELFPPDGESAPEVRTTVTTACESEGWSPDARRCLADAADEDAYIECARNERLRRGDDLGGPDCEAVVAATERHGQLADAAARASSLRFCRVQSRAFKECVFAIPDDASEADFAQRYAQCRADESKRRRER
ncbi:MAG: hypothetical protein KC431_06310 [Myxococcales bacterium]|nr:hypothetical protein [Myxococcales bacterium]